MQLAVILTSLGIILVGLPLYFFGKSTYTVSYDEKAEHFNLTNPKESVIIKKNDVLDVHKNITVFQTWWPLPNHYYYILTVNNEVGKKLRFRFVIWSNQPQLLKNYERLARSVAKWNKEKQSQND